MPTGNTRTLPSRPFLTFVRLADPDWARDKRIVVEYDFTDVGGRIFTGNPLTRGVYAPEEE